MEYIDAANLKSTELNKEIISKLERYGEVTVQNPHSMHNVAAGLPTQGKVVIQGSTGFYTGGFMEGTTLQVEGNAGWYAGDNMMEGELLINKNTGCNAGTYICGGNIVVYGNTGSRVGYGMKGGTIIVCGSAGPWAGQMTMGGKLIILGKAGSKMGESMYKGAIFVRDPEAGEKIGSNVFLDIIKADEEQELKALFARYDITADPAEFKVVRPMQTGRHTYVLFNPDLKPELSRKMSV